MPPSQPPLNTSYKTPGNPATADPIEQRQQHDEHPAPPPVVERRTPPTTADRREPGVDSSLARGAANLGAPPGEERFGYTQEELADRPNLEGEQMRAPGEGAVADAVDMKRGAGGEQPDLAGDLERKKQEQAEMREAIHEQRRHGVNVDGGDPRSGATV